MNTYRSFFWILLLVTISVQSAYSIEATAPNKFVGAMYSVWFDSVNKHELSPIYPTDVTSPNFRYWGEPAAGRYLSINIDTVNRHADEMSILGLDFIFVDLSNSGLYDPLQLNATKTLLQTYANRQLQGKPYPKITLLLTVETGQELVDAYTHLYSKYNSNIFFEVGGKPLLLVNGSCDANYSHKFTCRTTWGLGSGKEWSFLELTPQPVHSRNGWSEQMAVSAAQQIGFMNAPNARGRKFNYLTGRNDGVEGQNLKDQWNEAYRNSPTYILVTSYNEWVSQKLTSGHYAPCNMTFCYVDQYNREFSKDIEPMKACSGPNCESHGRLYYDLMKQYIEKYKSTAANLVLRDSSNGSWHFKFGRGHKSRNDKNYSETFQWASGSHYQMINGDFNGDNLMDIGLRDVISGKWHFALNNGNYYYHNSRNFSWVPGSHYQPLVGDFNGDGHHDIALRDSFSGRWHFAFFDGVAHYANSRNFDWVAGDTYQPVVGDFNGDGKADIALRNSTNGRWHFAFYDGGSWYHNNRNFDWAPGGNYQAFVGDFNCDSKLDIGLRDALSGMIYLTAFDGGQHYANEHAYKWNAGENLRLSVDQSQCNASN